MMKKIGFTLAEVLITLGIIGVVAALTAPALVQNTGTAKTGPTLAKVVSTIENANERILTEQGASSLATVAGDNEAYCELLSQNIRKSSYSDDALEDSDSNSATTTWDNSSLFPDMGYSSESFNEFKFADNIALLIAVSGEDLGFYAPRSSFLGAYGVLIVDINGLTTKPNVAGKDIFVFFIDRSGQMIPGGSSTEAWLFNDDSLEYSSNDSSRACNENNVSKGYGCAGSIFENNLKVIYQ